MAYQLMDLTDTMTLRFQTNRIDSKHLNVQIPIIYQHLQLILQHIKNSYLNSGQFKKKKSNKNYCLNET